jgi:hypothetical protein
VWVLPLTNAVPVAVIIPTYNRALAVLSVLEKIQACDPKPVEIWVHVDSADGTLESFSCMNFPDINVLASPIRLGGGGERHRCLLRRNIVERLHLDPEEQIFILENECERGDLESFVKSAVQSTRVAPVRRL